MLMQKYHKTSEASPSQRQPRLW